MISKAFHAFNKADMQHWHYVVAEEIEFLKLKFFFFYYYYVYPKNFIKLNLILRYIQTPLV